MVSSVVSGAPGRESNVKKRLQDCFVEAEGAFPGRGEPAALDEHKAAGPAFRRDNLQDSAAGLDAAANMLQMSVHLLFRYVGQGGDIPGGEGLAAEQVDNHMPDRLLGRARYGRFSRFLSHEDPWRDEGCFAKYYHLIAALQAVLRHRPDDVPGNALLPQEGWACLLKTDTWNRWG